MNRVYNIYVWFAFNSVFNCCGLKLETCSSSCFLDSFDDRNLMLSPDVSDFFAYSCIVRTGSMESEIVYEARNLSLSSYYKRANRAQLSRRHLTKCTAGTERRRRRRRRHSECSVRKRSAIGFGIRIGIGTGIAYYMRCPKVFRVLHSVCLLLFRLFIATVVVLFLLLLYFFLPRLSICDNRCRKGNLARN